MESKRLASIVMLEAYFAHLPKRFDYNGKTYAVKDQVQSWTVTGKVNYRRFAVVLENGEPATIYRFIEASGDEWKIEVTEKVEA